ncbi:phospholipase [Streptomyces sp. NPDC048479]|uniref:phospholipase n=1 Tax=Streptomyces sp. NPDC048479 TaxID=3154725 RepID=UPI003424D24C
MNKVQAAFSGIALAGVVGFASVTPAAADPVDVTTKTGSSVSQAGEVAPMVGHQVRLNKLRALTGNDQASQNQWFDYLALNQQGSNYYRFDWSTDGCSKVSDSPLGFHFYSACHRHDFGYRNHKKLSVFSAANKLRIDQAFLSDMTKVCNSQWGPYTTAQRAACRNVAKKYYQAVRTFGELRP